MNAVVKKIYNSLTKKHRQILITTSLTFFGFLTSVAIAIPLDKVSYNIIMTSDGYPIIFPKENIYGFDEKLTETELINNTQYCGSGAGCSPDALAKGALYFVVHTVNGKEVIAYYNVEGKLVATQQAGTNTPTNPTLEAKLPTPNKASFSDSTADPVGYVEGEFAVSDSGAATYNVPIALPPGTAGVQPSISLAYSSQSGEGVAGLGWSISGLSAISRCPKNKTQDREISGVKFDSTDNYCLDGQRLVRISGTQGGNGAKYKTEIDNYSEITSYDDNGDRSPEYFTVETKAGEIHVFGNTEDSRVERVFPSSVTQTDEQKNAYSWAINRTKDRLGNYIDYVYNESRDESLGLEHTLKQIKYTGNINTGLTPYIFIDFIYKTKTLPTSGYFAGSKVYRSQQLETIKVRHQTALIRQYNLVYYGETNELNSISKQDKLKSIEECGDTACLPATYFKWDGTYKDPNFIQTKTLAAKNLKSKSLYNPTISDLLGKELGSKRFNISKQAVFKRTTTERIPNNAYGKPVKFAYLAGRSNKFIGDVNGDGLSDIIGVNWEANQSKQRWKRQVQVGLGLGSGAFDTTSFNVDSVNASVGYGTQHSSAIYRYPSRVADVNGDGLVDIVHFNDKNVEVYLSNGSGFDPRKSWLGNVITYNVGWREGVHQRLLQDVNGDGKADLIGIAGGKVYVYPSTGTSFSSTREDWSKNWGSTRLVSNFSAEENAVEFIDISSDGLPDLVVHNLYGTSVYINNANNKSFDILPRGLDDVYENNYYDSHTNYILHNPPNGFYYMGLSVSSGGRDHQRIMGDVNGDGYPDIVGFFISSEWSDATGAWVLTNKSGTYIAYGTGNGFKPYVKVSDQWGTRNSEYYPSQLIDVNADGKADLVNFGEDGTYVQLSNGTGFGDKETWTAEFGRTTEAVWNSIHDMRTFGDFNGDGLLDVIGIDDKGVHLGINQTRSLRITGITSGGILPDNATTDTMPMNGVNRSIEIIYDKLTSKTSTYTKQNNATTDQVDIQPAMYVVSSHYSSNGDISYNIIGSGSSAKNNTAGMQYTYEGLKVDKKRGSLGFAKRTVKDLISNIRTTKTYKQSFPLVGSPLTEVTEIDIGDETYVRLNESRVNSTFKQYPGLSGNYYSVYTYHKVETDYNLAIDPNTILPASTSSPYKRVTTSMSQIPADHQCGNEPWIRVTTRDLTNNASFSKYTNNTYRTTGDCFNQSRLINATVTSTGNTGTGSTVRKSAFTYTGDGQIRTETVEPADKLSTITTYGYDAYGNVDSKSIRGATRADGTGKQTRSSTTVYGAPYFRFATSVTNNKNHTETRTYDKKFGTLTSVTGPNGLTSKTYYNQFGQKYLTVAPNNTWVHTKYEWCNVDMGEANNVARYCTTTTSSEGGYSKVYYDQIDRVVRKETKGLNGRIIRTEKIYNLNNGQLISETSPHFVNETPLKTNYIYDVLERSSKVIRSDGSESRVRYNGFTTTVIDANNKEKTTTINALGKPSLITDELGNTIKYTYYADGNLETTTNTATTNGGQAAADISVSTTSFKYDKLGNKIEMADPDMDVWRYAYNAFGELVSQTDANNQTTTMTYDVLGRLIKRVAKEGTTNWVYDTAQGKSVGKLHRVTSSASGYSKILTYNDLGQVTRLDEKLPNGIATSGTRTYTTKTTYDAHGRVDQVIYPTVNLLVAPIRVQHVYGLTGALKSIKDATTARAYWTVNSADAKGNILSQRLGNGVISKRSYDSLGRLKTIESKKGGTYLQNLDYTFDAIGNLTKRHNLISKTTELFKYDSLYRLDRVKTSYTTSAGTASAPTKTFKYDGHGNIKNKNGKAYDYLGGRTHAVSKISGVNYKYDSNGNLTCSSTNCNSTTSASRKIEWKSFNKPAKITKKNATGKETTVKLAYDADHNRIIKESTHTDTAKIGKTTWYIAGGLVEREKTTSGSNSGAEIYKFTLKAGGQTVGYINQNLSKTGVFTANKTRYLLTDHLGSSDVVTDERGVALLKLSFDAWGKRRNDTWSNTTPTELETIIAGFADEAYKIGYTGHEHDDEVGLINMKGRLYDAEIGRFISADPYVQAATDTQSYNRYSYVRNNPLSLTDPSGYSWFSKLWKGITRFVKKWGRTILAIAATIYTAGLASAFFGSAIVGGAVGGFVGGLISTGTIKGALTGAVFGGLSAGLANWIGHGSSFKAAFGNLGRFGKSIAHGIAQGTVNVLRGGKFGAGFVSAFASHYGAPYMGGGKYLSTAKAAILGGTVSKLVGGKFANGAVTAAFVHMFNQEGGQMSRHRKYLKQRIARLEKSIRIQEGNMDVTGTYDELMSPGVPGQAVTLESGITFRFGGYGQGWYRMSSGMTAYERQYHAQKNFQVLVTDITAVVGMIPSPVGKMSTGFGMVMSLQQGDFVGATYGATGLASGAPGQVGSVASGLDTLYNNHK